MIAATAAISIGALGGCATLEKTWNESSTNEKVGAVAGAVVMNAATGGGHGLAVAGHAAWTAAGGWLGYKAGGQVDKK